MKFLNYPKLIKGDKVAIISPSFAAPAVWPHVYELGLKRLKEEFGLEPVEYPTTKKLNATSKERSDDIITAFSDPQIKAVIATLGGNDQITYVKNLPKEVFINNPKPFFGYSDNTQLVNFLWHCNIPAYYGGMIFTQYAECGKLNNFTVKFLKMALFESGKFEIEASKEFSDEGLDWNDQSNLTKIRKYEPNSGWHWDGKLDANGIAWGGCFESIDEILRHNITIPSLEEFNKIVLYLETSEELPSKDYVFRILRALGERQILQRVKGILIGRPKAFEWGRSLPEGKTKEEYKALQEQTILQTVREYNKEVPIIQNLDFGHTEPNICIPSGRNIEIQSSTKRIFVEF